MTKQNEEAKVTLVNAGKLTLKTSAGDFGPQGKISVPPDVAARLLKYSGIMRASDYKPEDHAASAARVAELEAANADLAKKLEVAASVDASAVQEDLDKATVALDGAAKRITELEEANADLSKQVASLQKKLDKQK